MPITVVWNEDDGSVNCLALDIYEEETYEWKGAATSHPVESGGNVTDQVRLDNPRLTVRGYVTNKPGPSNYLHYGAAVVETEGLQQDDTAAGDYEKFTIEVNTKKEYSLKTVKLDVPGRKPRANAGALLRSGFDALFGNEPTAQQRVQDKQSRRRAEVVAWRLKDPTLNRMALILDALVQLQQGRKRCNVMSDLRKMLDCVITEISVPKTVEDGEGAPFVITFEQIKTAFATATEAPRPDSGLQPTKNAGSKAATYSADYPAEQTAAKLRSYLDALLARGHN